MTVPEAHKVLALDLASSTGWACGLAGDAPRSGTIPLGDKRHGERGAELIRWLNAFLKLESDIRLAIIEKPLGVRVLVKIGSTDETVRLLNGMAFLAQTVLTMRGVPDIRFAAVQDIREHFVGQRRFADSADPFTGKKVSSRANAKAAVRNACALRGWPAETDDQADAIAAWSYGCAILNPRLATLATPLFGRAA